MMLEGKSTRSIGSWCLKMKIRKKDMEVIKNTVSNIPRAVKDLEQEIKDDSKLYSKVNKYSAELLAILYSRGGGYACNIKRYYTRLADIKLDIGGEDLKEMGYSPSPVFKKVLDRVFRMKINGKVIGRKDELAAAERLIKKYPDSRPQARSRAR
jgi:tRNA nucleotidyltransferase (CCA-adding enzyme)